MSRVPNPSRRQGLESQGRRALSMGDKDPRGSHRAPQGTGTPDLLVAPPLIVRDGVITIDSGRVSISPLPANATQAQTVEAFNTLLAQLTAAGFIGA